MWRPSEIAFDDKTWWYIVVCDGASGGKVCLFLFSYYSLSFCFFFLLLYFSTSLLSISIHHHVSPSLTCSYIIVLNISLVSEIVFDILFSLQ